MNEIYLVISSSGECEYYSEIVERAFATKESADKYAKELDEHLKNKYNWITSEIIDTYEDAEVWLTNYKKRNLALFENKIFYKENPEEYLKRRDEINAIETKLMLNYMSEHGITLTSEKLKEIENYGIEQYMNIHPSIVQKVKFVNK